MIVIACLFPQEYFWLLLPQVYDYYISCFSKSQTKFFLHFLFFFVYNMTEENKNHTKSRLVKA